MGAGSSGGWGQDLTGQLHELVEEEDGEERLPELPQVQFEDTGHRVDVGGVGDVGQRVLAALERLAEVVDLHLTSGHAEDTLVVKTCQIQPFSMNPISLPLQLDVGNDVGLGFQLNSN